MAGQLIPPPELDPPTKKLSPAQGIAAWFDLMGTMDGLIRARLRRQIGPGGDLKAAYQAWYERQLAEHDEKHRLLGEKMKEWADRDAS